VILPLDDDTARGLVSAMLSASGPPPVCPTCGERMQSHACRYRSCRREYRQQFRHGQADTHRRALMVALVAVAVLVVVVAFAATLGATS
jgi:hypothetical protein